MLDFILTAGQAASAMLLVYGGCLVLMPARSAPALNRKLADEPILLKHIHTDA
jgi:hypothetical protein